MTGAKGGNNPWRDLAARIMSKALEDYREIGPNDAEKTRLGLRQDVTKWISEDEGFCRYLLDCLGYEISNRTLLERCCCEYVKQYYWYRADHWWCPEHKYQDM